MSILRASLAAYLTLCTLKVQADNAPSPVTEQAYLDHRAKLLASLSPTERDRHYEVVSSRSFGDLGRTLQEDTSDRRRLQLGERNWSEWLNYLRWAQNVLGTELRDRFFPGDQAPTAEGPYSVCTAVRLGDYHLPVAVDTQDADIFARVRPKLYRKQYPSCSGGFMHRTVAKRHHGDITGLEVDHVNGNTFDCRAANLRVCDRSQNNRNKGHQSNNTSNRGFKGVAFYPKYGKYRAQIALNRRTKCIGFFATPEEAAIAYDLFARRFHGDYARLNMPDVTQEQIDRVIAQLMSNKSGRGSTSRYYGVSWSKIEGRWRGDIRHKKQYHYLGWFDDEEEAARAVDAQLLKMGCREKLNFGKTLEDVIKI